MLRLKPLQLKRGPLIIAVCLLLFAGVAVAHTRQLSDARWLSVVVLLTAFSWRRRVWLGIGCLLLLSFGVGWWRGSGVMQQLSWYEALSHRQVTLVGRATDDGVYGQRYQMTFGMDRVRLVSPQDAKLPGQINVAGFGTPAVYRGDYIQVTGKLYKTRGNAQAGVSFATLQVVQRNTSWIDSLRRKFAAGMQSALPEPLASFGLGLLIGQRSTLPPEVAQTLVAVGLTHIIAVSGYNLTIIIQAARRLFADRSKFQMTAFCVVLIGVFLLLTGNSPSIVRASIISVLSIFAWYFGRSFKPLVLLLVAAAITIVANPLYLWGNVSWYLSFLAFFGVVVLGPLLTQRLYGDRQPRLLVQILIESLCAEIMTLPYILYIFGQMSWVALPANVLVVALVPLAMLLCTIAGLAGMLVPAIAGWLAWPARELLTYMLDTAQLLSRTPHAFVERVGFSLTQLLIWYGIVGLLLLMVQYKKSPKRAILTEKNEPVREGG